MDKANQIIKDVVSMSMCLTAGTDFCPITCDGCQNKVDTDAFDYNIKALVNAYVDKQRALQPSPIKLSSEQKKREYDDFTEAYGVANAFFEYQQHCIEEEDKFIFKCIKGYCGEIVQKEITKAELEEALTMWQAIKSTKNDNVNYAIRAGNTIYHYGYRAGYEAGKKAQRGV